MERKRLSATEDMLSPVRKDKIDSLRGRPGTPPLSFTADQDREILYARTDRDGLGVAPWAAFTAEFREEHGFGCIHTIKARHKKLIRILSEEEN